MWLLQILGSIFLLFTLPGAALAEIITLTPTDMGNYMIYGDVFTGHHDPSNDAITLFNDGSGDSDPTHGMRHWFLFDLSEIEGAIYSVSLTLETGEIFFLDGSLRAALTPDELTYTMYGVDTPTSILTAGGDGLSSVFDDLGSGDAFGTRTYTREDNGAVVDIAMNGAGVAAVQAAVGGYFALGGAVASDSEGRDRYLTYAEGGIRQLSIEVPEPAGLALFGIGTFVVFGFQAHGRRRGKHCRTS
jgi:hypothetical protein